LNTRERVSAAALASLLALVPFEPRHGLLRAFGLDFTLLEVAAGACAAALLVLHRPRRPLARSAPLLALAALAAAHLLSAALAPAHRAAAAVFSLRLLAALVFALAVAGLPRHVLERGLTGLAVGGAACALLAVLEVLGTTSLDPLLDVFRERAFRLGDGRRATGGAAGPNVGAAFIAAGLLAGVARIAPRPLGVRAGVGLAAALGAGLLATYSRGGTAACLAGLAVLAWAFPAGSQARRAATAALVTLAALAGAFAASQAFRPRWTADWPSDLSARCELMGEPPRFTPDAAARVRFRVTNDGPRDWPADPTFRLAVGWFDPELGRAEHWASFPFGRGLLSGRSTLVEADLRAPARPGPYVLLLDVNSGATGYLSTAGRTPGWVPVAVGTESEPPSAVPPPRTRRGRLELWRIALVMWRAHPLTGVGPDNFRRLHVEYGEWIAPGNVRLGAHNVFLEAAATTGALGLAALVLVFAGGARAAWRARPAVPLAGAVLALLALLAGQGLVDSLLGFTGIYLLFAFVVGSAAALGRAE
jgi:hypothetical protein